VADASKLLHTTTDSDTFLENLFADTSLLREAKQKIRAHLRKEFGKAGRDRFGQEVRPRVKTASRCCVGCSFMIRGCRLQRGGGGGGSVLALG
jgi:hypothetical protein